MNSVTTLQCRIPSARWPIIRRNPVRNGGLCRTVCFEWLLCVLIGMMMTVLTPTANAAGHIKVTREILLESGIPVEPNAIVQTRDGGYVVAGYTGQAWATRIDSAGNVLWRYVMANTISWFYGAAMLPDDSVILCGKIEQKKSDGFHISALLTHLDKEGKVLSERLLSPNDGKRHGITELHSCFPFEDGVAVFGSATAPVWGQRGAAWFIALDGKGNIKSEILVQDMGVQSIQTLPDHSIVSYNRPYDGMQVSVLARNGTVKATRLIYNWSFPVKPMADSSIRLLTSDHRGTLTLDLLNDKLEQVSQLKSAVEFITPSRAYMLPDHSLMLFGLRGASGNVLSASMQWISPDMTQDESYVFGAHTASVKILDAIPTGVPGEFVTIREVTPTHQLLGFNEKRQGAVLAFVHVK